MLIFGTVLIFGTASPSKDSLLALGLETG